MKQQKRRQKAFDLGENAHQERINDIIENNRQ